MNVSPIESKDTRSIQITRNEYMYHVRVCIYVIMQDPDLLISFHWSHKQMISIRINFSFAVCDDNLVMSCPDIETLPTVILQTYTV